MIIFLIIDYNTAKRARKVNRTSISLDEEIISTRTVAECR
jgi:hypothetical protein